ncbi:1-acyl-sn-glycerol-3-phosphate acyltransferase [Pseudoroseicyclus aestuarii]|uniref:Glycerol-3-phosphate acyltransferase n=1 Tax=Pseudoroseicyclus aestuarii TaxID=1795041 RepID=A0A318SWK5_9RHOB|nr:1-acyl-sn-glycerol-3-phosphate acyltransferase [Pseudoroseicyclus aestuarii]PYE84766.1 glycerol-3-phosphate acyltransferase [Pseudoroseicyclus aestuarii]
MSRTVSLPLWLFGLILLFAAVTFASHFLFPSVRWFFRKRMERAVARLNRRLARPIEPFKLARRHDMIQRLIYDPSVVEAALEHARSQGVPENVAFELARDYAREIVPAFSATVYFTFGIRLAKALSRLLYRVRLGELDMKRLERIDPEASVIFVMNHRSNMDYVLVTWLASRTSALSYAVGEWARIWPLSAMIRSMGAYFIRRRDRTHLYRRVLARYVQLATEGGVTQAFFPEGGLSLTGRQAEPRLGLLNYIVSGASERRDVIFVPVAINYDRVLEDRVLIAAGALGQRRFRAPIRPLLRGTVFYLWRRVTGRLTGFGTASVAFGTPLSLAQFRAGHGGETTAALAEELMRRVAETVPVLPVPLVCWLLLERQPRTEAVLLEEVGAALDRLTGLGVQVPRRDTGEVMADALRILRRRRLVAPSSLSLSEEGIPLLRYYANSIAHHFEAPALPAPTLRPEQVL